LLAVHDKTGNIPEDVGRHVTQGRGPQNTLFVEFNPCQVGPDPQTGHDIVLEAGRVHEIGSEEVIDESSMGARDI
jgi:hypothetical protein